MEWKVDHLSVVRDRNLRLHKIRSSDKVFSAHWIYYKSNPVAFINDWVWTYDPRELDSPIMPFVLFPKQEEFILWLLDKLINKGDGLVEKSRDMGATWLCCAFAVWAWLFIDGVSISFGSRKQEYVDVLGDPDSIFEKMRMILRSLPVDFLPAGIDKKTGLDFRFEEKRDATFMKLINRKTSATITGESGDNIGRGGRSSMYFKDESAFYERPMLIEAALSANSEVKIDVSTPNGQGNPFYKKRFAGIIPVFTFHWKDDPRKDQAWYDRKVLELDELIVAQEIDINYSASIEDICIEHKWILAAVDFCEKYDIEPTGIKTLGFDVADEGSDPKAYSFRHGIKTIFCDEWKDGDAGDASVKTYLKAEEVGADLINYDNIGVGSSASTVFKRIKRDKPNPIKTFGFCAGAEVPTGFWEHKKKNKDMFINLKVYAWWSVRRRFKKTYEYVTKGKPQGYDFDELISIPNDLDLIRELSTPKHFANDAGKYRMENKKELKKRGIKSPNKADAFVMSYHKPRSQPGVFGNAG